MEHTQTMDVTTNRQRLQGIVFSTLSAASFGIAPIFARIAYNDGLNTTTAMFLRFAISGTIMAVLFQWQGEGGRGQNLLVLL